MNLFKNLKKKNNEWLEKKRQNIINKMKEKERITIKILEQKYLENQEKIKENEIKFIERQNYINQMKKE